MTVSGIGSNNTYIYNVKTGKLATKDGSEDEFTDYFNGELKGEKSETLNGFDSRNKNGIERLIWYLKSGPGACKGIFSEGSADEIEITAETTDVATTHYSVNGEKVLTAYMMGAFSFVDSPQLPGTVPYKTQESKPYDSIHNRVFIAVGDEFDLGNGYRLKVEEDHVSVSGLGSGSEEEDQKVKRLAFGMNALIHFADQQWMAATIEKQVTPMLLELLREMGVDTSREFQINETKCELKHDRIVEVGNRFAIPSTIYQEAAEKYEQFLYQPLSQRTYSS